MKRTILFPLMLLLFALAAAGQPKLDDYSKICYCSGRTPHSVLGYDNNWQLLLACMKGQSKAGLDSLHIPCTDSQLRLMTLFKLVRLEKDRYYTDIPVFDSVKTMELRGKSKQLAGSILPFIESDVGSMRAELGSQGHAGSCFSIVFSYLLDGKVWSKFIEKKLLDRLNLTVENAPWTGTFWLFTPARQDGFGTNGEYDSACTLLITTVPHELNGSVYDEDHALLKLFLREAGVSGRVSDPRVIAAFAKYNMVDAGGKVMLPVITENGRDRIFALADRAADTICSRLVSGDLFNDMIGEFGLRDRQQAIIIIYHEVMWELLAGLEAKNLIHRPVVLTDPAKPGTKDLSDLMFLVK